MTDYECYRSIKGTTDNDECEADCGNIMSEGQYVEGRYGHYCSIRCKLANESDSDDVRSSDDDARSEARQMGFTALD